MALIGYDFQVVNSSGTGVTGITFPGTGAIAAPGLVSLVTHDTAQTTITPSAASFKEQGQGYYTVFYDAAVHGEAFAIVDAGGGVSGANRYIGMALTADSSRLLAAISAEGLVQGLDAHALDVVEFPADLTSIDDARRLIVQGLAYLRHLLAHSRLGADGSYVIQNDVGDTIDMLQVESTGGVLSVAPGA